MNFLAKLFGPNDIGIDLGAAKTRAWVRGEGLLLEEPSAEYSSNGGVIPDFDTAKKTLRRCIAKLGRGRLRSPRVIISVHSGITDDEKCMMEKAARSAGASVAFLIESPMAAAIGAGLPVSEPKGRMVVNIGASTTEVVVVSLAGIVHSKILCIGGDAMDSAIVEYMRGKHDLVIGKQEAEEIKIKIGTAFRPEEELEYEVKGEAAGDGHPLSVTITSKEVREEALSDVLGQIAGVVRDLLDITEPELAADLVDTGIVLTGGGALLRGLDKRLADATGLPVRVAENPAHATVKGVGVVLCELDFLSKFRKK